MSPSRRLGAVFALVCILLLSSGFRSARASGSCPADVVVLVDGSGSITPVQFSQMKDFLRFMLDGIAIGPNADQSHMSIIQYDHNAAVESTLTGSRTSLEAAIQNMNLLAGGTRIDRALTAAGNELSARARPGSRRVILLVTDGVSATNPNDPSTHPTTIANDLKASGVRIVSVALGSSADTTTMRTIASSVNEYVEITSTNYLLNIIAPTRSSACGSTSISISSPPAQDTIFPPRTRNITLSWTSWFRGRATVSLVTDNNVLVEQLTRSFLSSLRGTNEVTLPFNSSRTSTNAWYRLRVTDTVQNVEAVSGRFKFETITTIVSQAMASIANAVAVATVTASTSASVASTVFPTAAPDPMSMQPMLSGMRFITAQGSLAGDVPAANREFSDSVSWINFGVGSNVLRAVGKTNASCSNPAGCPSSSRSLLDVLDTVSVVSSDGPLALLSSNIILVAIVLASAYVITAAICMIEAWYVKSQYSKLREKYAQDDEESVHISDVEDSESDDDDEEDSDDEMETIVESSSIPTTQTRHPSSVSVPSTPVLPSSADSVANESNVAASLSVPAPSSSTVSMNKQLSKDTHSEFSNADMENDYQKVKKKLRNVRVWRLAWMAALSILTAAYQSLATSSLAASSGTSSGSSNDDALTVIIAIFILVMFVIGFPLFAVWLSVFKKKQLNRDGSKLHLRFASLFEDMRKSHSYFIALQQMKDLGLAVCISFVYNAPTTQIGLMIGFQVVYIALSIWLRPFESRFEEINEIVNNFLGIVQSVILVLLILEGENVFGEEESGDRLILMWALMATNFLLVLVNGIPRLFDLFRFFKTLIAEGKCCKKKKADDDQASIVDGIDLDLLTPKKVAPETHLSADLLRSHSRGSSDAWGVESSNSSTHSEDRELIEVGPPLPHSLPQSRLLPQPISDQERTRRAADSSSSVAGAFHPVAPVPSETSSSTSSSHPSSSSRSDAARRLLELKHSLMKRSPGNVPPPPAGPSSPASPALASLRSSRFRSSESSSSPDHQT